jgi:putative ABC transport system substrate-binding protein
MGLVKSLAHPGGNATGLTFVTVDLASKRIQLLKEAIPSAKRVAILWGFQMSFTQKAAHRSLCVVGGYQR